MFGVWFVCLRGACSSVCLRRWPFLDLILDYYRRPVYNIQGFCSMGTRHRIDRTFIRTITPTGKYRAFQDADLTGFGIKVSLVGTIAYTYRWVKPDGTQGRRNVGRWPGLQPGEARELCCREIALLDRKGDSPLQLVERKTQRAAVQKVAGVPTVGAFLDGRYELYLQTKLAQDRAAITAKMIRMSFPALLDTPLDECTAYMIED
jgi:hypothetical protein